MRFDEVFQRGSSLAFRAPIPRVSNHLDPLSRTSVGKDDVPFRESVVRNAEQVLQDAGPGAVDDERGLDAGSRGRVRVRQELRLEGRCECRKWSGRSGRSCGMVEVDGICEGEERSA